MFPLRNAWSACGTATRSTTSVTCESWVRGAYYEQAGRSRPSEPHAQVLVPHGAPPLSPRLPRREVAPKRSAHRSGDWSAASTRYDPRRPEPTERRAAAHQQLAWTACLYLARQAAERAESRVFRRPDTFRWGTAPTTCDPHSHEGISLFRAVRSGSVNRCDGLRYDLFMTHRGAYEPATHGRRHTLFTRTA